MKTFTIISTVLAGLIFGFIQSQQIGLPAKVRMQEQTEGVKLASQTNSEGVVEGVDLQRTRVYHTKALQRPTSMSWETRKIFGMQYVAQGGYISQFGGVDPTTGINRTGYEEGYTFNKYSFSTGFDFSDPIIADGVVYFDVYIGDGYLMAIDIDALREKWVFKLKREQLSEPAIAYGTVFVGASNGSFYALDAKTGQEKWTFKNKDRGYTFSSPLVDDGVVFFGSENGNYYAVDATTGKVNWTFKAKDATSPAAIFGDIIYFGAGVELLALDKKTGQKKWSFGVKNGWGTPVIANETVYYEADSFLHAIDSKTGQEKWRAELKYRKNWLTIKKGEAPLLFDISSLQAITNMAVADGAIYLGWLDRFYAFDTTTGKQKWEFEVGTTMRSPVIAEDIVYFGSYGKLYALDAKTGVKLWTIATTDQTKDKTQIHVPSSPAVLNGVIYYVSDDGKVYAIR
ncbi:MAG: eukaryotic-like serine/threonine-protein kinase [Acidobacteriota bacterium]|jgi:outer membrane protein assembly factor BamB|nr:eukaryotic-like serine/threonine-protein kinase [Acidobacteriota bacterium]